MWSVEKLNVKPTLLNENSDWRDYARTLALKQITTTRCAFAHLTNALAL